MPRRDFTAYFNALSNQERKGALEELAHRLPVYDLAEVLRECLPDEDCEELCHRLMQDARS